MIGIYVCGEIEFGSWSGIDLSHGGNRLVCGDVDDDGDGGRCCIFFGGCDDRDGDGVCCCSDGYDYDRNRDCVRGCDLDVGDDGLRGDDGHEKKKNDGAGELVPQTQHRDQGWESGDAGGPGH